MHVKTLRFLCTRNAFVPCTYVKWRYETHSLDADDIPHGSLFQKRIIVCHLAQKKYTFCQYSGRGSFSHFTPNLHEVGTWLYALIPRTSTHIFYIVYHCSPCLVHQNSAYLRDANQLTETVSGGLTHCVRGQRSVVPWHDACTDRLKADAMPVACRSPALRFRLRGPHQAAIPSAIERTSPSDWVRTPGDGWNGTDSTCALHASHLG